MSASPVWLLDVNVLVAAAWPDHQFHAAAHRWLDAKAGDLWATCAFTQSAFVRVSCNPQVFPHAVTPQQATRLLEHNTAKPRHRYWSECPALDQLRAWSTLSVQGYRQVADAYLLALTQHHGGKLATFDTGVASLLPKPADRRRWVEVIPP